MPDMTVALGATAFFGLTTTNGFYAQDSSSDDTDSESMMLTAVGNKAASHVYNKGDDFSCRFKYNGTTLRTSIGVMGTAIGKVVSGKIATDMDIEFSADGDR